MLWPVIKGPLHDYPLPVQCESKPEVLTLFRSAASTRAALRPTVPNMGEIIYHTQHSLWRWKGRFLGLTNAAVSLLCFKCSILTLGFAVNVSAMFLIETVLLITCTFSLLVKQSSFFLCVICLEKLGIEMLWLFLLFIIKGKPNAVKCIYLSSVFLSACSVDAPCHLNYVTALG